MPNCASDYLASYSNTLFRVCGTSDASPIIGKKSDEVAETTKIIGAIRNGRADSTVFDGKFTLQEGDTLLILGDLSSLKKHLEKITSKQY